MREIKLRAWDKRNKRFGYFTFHPRQFSFPSPKWMKNQLVREIDGDIGGVYFEDIEGFQQFTGVHDKNGKEIWEEDIYKHLYGIWKVEDLTDFLIKYGYMDDEWHNSIEVIGNIYENGDLINGK